MVSKDGARKKTISTIAVVGILVTISLAYFIPGIHPGHIVNYSEKTLFLGNNTLIKQMADQWIAGHKAELAKWVAAARTAK